MRDRRDRRTFLDVAIQRKLGAFTLDCVFSARRGVTALFGARARANTIANAIAGIVTPMPSRAHRAARPLRSSSAIDVPVERRGVGCVPGCAAVSASACRGQPALRRVAHPRPRIDPSFDAVVDVLAIGHAAAPSARPVGGERQRVALVARAAHAAADPGRTAAALDASHRHEILPYLVELAERFALPMIYVSHAIDEASVSPPTSCSSPRGVRWRAVRSRRSSRAAIFARTPAPLRGREHCRGDDSGRPDGT